MADVNGVATLVSYGRLSGDWRLLALTLAVGFLRARMRQRSGVRGGQSGTDGGGPDRLL